MEMFNNVLSHLEIIKSKVSVIEYYSIHNKIIDLYLHLHFSIPYESKIETKCNCINKKLSCFNLFALKKCRYYESITENFPMIKILIDKGYGKTKLPIRLNTMSNNIDVIEYIEYITRFSEYNNKVTKLEIVALISCMMFIVSNFERKIRRNQDTLRSMVDMIDHFVDTYKCVPDLINSIFREFFSHTNEECVDIIKSWKPMVEKWYKIE